MIADQDLAIVKVFLSTGNAGFAPASQGSIPVDSQPQAMAIMDFDRDGHPDLVLYTTGLRRILAIARRWSRRVRFAFDRPRVLATDTNDPGGL